jgi:hypothetical protein
MFNLKLRPLIAFVPLQSDPDRFKAKINDRIEFRIDDGGRKIKLTA